MPRRGREVQPGEREREFSPSPVVRRMLPGLFSAGSPRDIHAVTTACRVGKRRKRGSNILRSTTKRKRQVDGKVARPNLAFLTSRARAQPGRTSPHDLSGFDSSVQHAPTELLSWIPTPSRNTGLCKDLIFSAQDGAFAPLREAEARATRSPARAPSRTMPEVRRYGCRARTTARTRCSSRADRPGARPGPGPRRAPRTPSARAGDGCNARTG